MMMDSNVVPFETPDGKIHVMTVGSTGDLPPTSSGHDDLNGAVAMWMPVACLLAAIVGLVWRLS